MSLTEFAREFVKEAGIASAIGKGLKRYKGLLTGKKLRGLVSRSGKRMSSPKYQKYSQRVMKGMTEGTLSPEQLAKMERVGNMVIRRGKKIGKEALKTVGTQAATAAGAGGAGYAGYKALKKRKK